MASRSSSCRTESVSFQGVRSHRKSWFRSRPLDDRRWVVVYIDRFGLGDQTMVGALGVDAQGNKMPPSVMQGSTENRTVRQRPLNNDPDTIGPYFGGQVCTGRVQQSDRELADAIGDLVTRPDTANSEVSEYVSEASLSIEAPNALSTD